MQFKSSFLCQAKPKKTIELVLFDQTGELPGESKCSTEEAVKYIPKGVTSNSDFVINSMAINQKSKLLDDNGEFIHYLYYEIIESGKNSLIINRVTFIRDKYFKHLKGNPVNVAIKNIYCYAKIFYKSEANPHFKLKQKGSTLKNYLKHVKDTYSDLTVSEKPRDIKQRENHFYIESVKSLPNAF
ncbi:hypothetical protein BpHYR1_030039 [Brachionus plicatilis]|uniref:Uncharacterized protein n=1 Tax=Brachionus plicatilis TaxID=10195 RepID=A0A3M7PEE0_BRAPC|nr:hypothetical protein BpHYR1_030039 [Brachionus plicatilis]